MNSEIRELSREKEAVAGEVQKFQGILPSLRSQKGDLTSKIRLLGEYNSQLQSAYASLTAWNYEQMPQAEAHRSWLEAEIHRLDPKLLELTERLEKLGREIAYKKSEGEKRIDEKAKEWEALKATIDNATEKLAALEREIEKGQDYLRELREEIKHVKLLRDIKGAVGSPRRGVDELGAGIEKVGEIVGKKKLPIGAALKLIKPTR